MSLKPGWERLRETLRAHDGLMSRDDARRAVSRDGGLVNHNTFAQYVLDLNHHGPREYGQGSTTELCYKLDPPDQVLPVISSTAIGGRILRALAVVPGKPMSYEDLIAQGWLDANNVGSSGHLQVEISRLRKHRGVGIDGSLYIKLIDSDRCEADSQPPSTFSRST
jgi:hypothetical protein